MAEGREVSHTPTCTICLGKFNSPRILPCSHSFCELCISEYIVSTVTQPGQKTFNCPVCRIAVEAEDPMMERSKWVFNLPLKLDPEFKQTRKIPKQHCHPCKRIDKDADACLWCCECNEALCQICVQVHSRLKTTSTHKTVSIENEDAFDPKTLSFLQATGENCLIHENRPAEMYCFDHEEAVCVLCLSADHRKCENIQPMDNVDSLKEENVTCFKSELANIQSEIKALVGKKSESKAVLQTTFTCIESQSLGIITQLKTKLDDLYIEFLKKAGLQQDELQGELDQTLKALSEYSFILEKMMQNIELAARYGSNIQLLRITNAIKCDLGKMGGNLYPLLSEYSEYKVNAIFDNTLEVFNKITGLGNLSVVNNKHESMWSENNRQIQDLLIKEVTFSRVCLTPTSVLEFPGETITSSVHLDYETCAVVTTYNNKLLKIVQTTSNKILHTATLNKLPKKLCFNSNTNILYGTSDGGKGFKCKVNDKTLQQLRECLLHEIVCGIDFCDGNIYIVAKKAILQTQDFEHNNTWITTSLSGYDDDISFDGKSKRFSIMASGGIIIFCNISDKCLRTFDSQNKVKNPKSIAFGPSGMLFVTDRPCSIKVISADEKSVRTLLPKLQKIQTVSDITVSHDKKKLYVSGGNYVEIYDIENDKKLK